MRRRLRSTRLGERLPLADLRVLKSVLPPWLLTHLRRLRDLGRRLAGLRFSSPRARRQIAAQEMAVLPNRPLISLVMPTYRTELRYLRAAVDSVRHQHYPEWELCVVDDGSCAPELERAMRAYAAAEPRIKFRALESNGGISAATNAGLTMCGGEFVGFLDHDDTLAPEALLRVVQALGEDPDLDVVYTDSDKLTVKGIRADPFLKPDWSPVYALGAMYIGHLLVVRRAVALAAGGFDSAFDKIQDFEFMLRVSEHTDRIHHIPEILYHWRAIPGSIAAGAEEKSGVPELQARAVSAHLERIGVAAEALPHERIPHRAKLAPRPGGGRGPGVSLVVPGGGDRKALDRLLGSVFAQTTYPDFELIVVSGPGDASPGDPRAIEVRDESGEPGRARACNLGAARARGEHLVFLAPEMEIVEPDWIEQLVLHAVLPGVAAVGPMLVRPDGRVAAAGFAIGLRDPASPMLAGAPADGDGYYGSLPCAREVSGLSARCLLVAKSDFDGAGGFNELYRGEYEGLDLCRRLYRRGLRAVYAPRPRVLDHRTDAARRAAADIVDRALFVDTWYDDLKRGDPFYSPGFARQRADYVPSGWLEPVYRAVAPLRSR